MSPCRTCPAPAAWVVFSRTMQLLAYACDEHLIDILRDYTTDPRLGVIVRPELNGQR